MRMYNPLQKLNNQYKKEVQNMETPINLKNTGIGTKRMQTLKPADCTVVSVETQPFGEGAKAGVKAVFYLKHPEKSDPIKVSTISIMREKQNKKEIVSLGAWVNLDEDKKILLGSTLATCLEFYKANNLLEMVSKTVHTEHGSDGYLAIKAY